jgi:hypothetical protein
VLVGNTGSPAGLDRRAQLFGAEHAVRADLVDLHAGVGRRAAELMPGGVRFAAGDDLVAGARQRAQRHLVGHGAAGQPHRGRFAQQLGHARLQPVGAGVLAVLVVADLGTGHRRAHRSGGPGDGVGAQVDRQAGWLHDGGRGSRRGGDAAVYHRAAAGHGRMPCCCAAAAATVGDLDRRAACGAATPREARAAWR